LIVRQSRFRLASLSLGVLLLVSLPGGTARACQIALALAVDVSGSVDAREYRIQMQGLADGLRHGPVAEALVKARARLLLVQWTGDSRQVVSIPWADIHGFDQLESFALDVETAPRRWWQFSTAIGAALDFTKTQFADQTDCARQVIDVSGDGRSNEGIAPASLQRGFWQDGFTVNALVIKGSEPDLVSYFWENVVAGENAFVISADGFAAYPERIKLKLLREVTQQVSGLPARRELRLAAD